MKTMQEEVDEEYNEACNNMAQVHLAQQTSMSNMSNSKAKMESVQQQPNLMTRMFQHTMNLAASKPLSLTWWVVIPRQASMVGTWSLILVAGRYLVPMLDTFSDLRSLHTPSRLPQ